MRKSITGMVLAAGLLAGLPGTAGAQVLFRVGGPYTDAAQDIACDGNGYIYITGTFQGNVDFDPGSGVAIRTAQGDPADPMTGASAVDIYLAKYDPAGRLVWVAVFGSPGFDIAHRVRLDPAGNIVLAGSFSGLMDIDPAATVHFLDAGSGRDAFLAKFSPEGALIWAVGIGDREKRPDSLDDPRGENILDFAFDVAGNIVVTGGFDGTVDFDRTDGPDALDTATSISGSRDIFLASYDSQGRFRWRKCFGGPKADEGRAVVCAADGTTTAAGIFLEEVEVQGGPRGLIRESSRGGTDIYVARFDAAGQPLWLETIGSAADDRVRPGGIAGDPAGGFILTGDFSLIANFELGDGVHGLASKGDGDVFVCKYTAEGGFVWALGIGSPYLDSGYRVATDPAGNVFVAGSFRGGADFDPGPASRVLVPAGSPDCGDAFLAKYGPDGKFLWAHNFGGPVSEAGAFQAGSALDVDAAGNALLAGRFHLAVDFDPGPGVALLQAAGGADGFAAKYDPDGNLFGGRIHYPPLNFRGVRMINRSLSQTEYINRLTWAANPGDSGAVAYRVYQILGTNRVFLAEVTATTFEYLHRRVEKSGVYIYELTAVDGAGREGGTASTTVE
jgi:hypothetical protein